MRGSAYAGMPFNGAMGLPVELTLRSTRSGPRVFLNPVREFASLRTRTHGVMPQVLSPGKNPLTGLKVELFEMVAEIAPSDAAEIVFNLRGVSVVYDAKYRELTCGEEKGPLEIEDGKIRLKFQRPQRAIATGQICALYDGGRLLGGGVFESVD